MFVVDFIVSLLDFNSVYVLLNLQFAGRYFKSSCAERGEMIAYLCKQNSTFLIPIGLEYVFLGEEHGDKSVIPLNLNEYQNNTR